MGPPDTLRVPLSRTTQQDSAPVPAPAPAGDPVPGPGEAATAAAAPRGGLVEQLEAVWLLRGEGRAARPRPGPRRAHS